MASIKNHLLASVALLSLGTGALAADLPTFKAAPVTYVRVCDTFGEGYFYLPGTDTCVKLSGAARYEITLRPGAPYNNAFSRGLNLAGNIYNRDLTSYRGRAFLNEESKTATAYGTLRSYLSLRMTNDPTQPGPSGGGKGATVPGLNLKPSTGFFQGFANPASIVMLDKAFIQFAGITAGRTNSFFDFDSQSHEILAYSIANSNQFTEVLAYTATFGAGFTTTLSVEDHNEREIGDDGTVAANITPTATKAGYLSYGGEAIPDIVGNVRVDQTWGSAQLAAAYHDVNSVAVTLPNKSIDTPKDQTGFAAIAGVSVNMPMLAKGDNFVVQGTYEAGAMDYLNPVNGYVGPGSIYHQDTTVGVPVNDGFVLPNGKIALNHGWGFYGAFQHYWTPAVNSTLFGAYAQIHNPNAAQLLGAGADNSKIYQVGANLLWTPVKNLVVGGEVLYTDQTLSGAADLSKARTNAAGIASPLDPNADDIRTRLTFRRAF